MKVEFDLTTLPNYMFRFVEGIMMVYASVSLVEHFTRQVRTMELFNEKLIRRTRDIESLEEKVETLLKEKEERAKENLKID